jgi:hypothetical protein
VLDLSDPFTDAELWRPPVARPADGLVERVTNVWRNPWRLPVDALRALAETVAPRGAAARLGFTGDHAMTLNNRACDLRAQGRTDEAEWLMRAALSVDLDVRPAGHPKIPHRRNNLATVLLIQHRLAEARAELARAWQETGSLYGLTSARILTVRLAAALIGGAPTACFVGQLKTQLAGDLRDFADVDRRWRFDTVLRSLEPRLAPASLDLLRAIGEALNGDRDIPSLDAFALWHEAPATPLDARWPPETEP